MPSPNVFERVVLAGLLAGAVATAARPARADEKQECADAYAQAQILRRDQELVSARDAASICKRDVCTQFIRTECATWFTEIDKAVPTVTLDVRDAAGAKALTARVAFDQGPWTDVEGPASRPLDPGHHVLHFQMAGSAPVDQDVDLREGEKNHPVHVVMQTNASVAVPISGAATAAPPNKRSIGPWVVGGVGLAGIAVGGVFGGLTLAKKSIVDDHCHAVGASWVCDATGRSATDAGKVFGPVSTVGLAVGGAGLGVAAVWLWLSRRPHTDAPATVGLVPFVTPDAAELCLHGRL